ncbi:MAG: SPFH domain-containing protein [Cetobacterium sp.]|uniref:SPFH domain-containing protein n=1 Tax=Cetobacterium sp. TaxID=2071632 RepID=UPI003EE4637F
MSKFPIKAVIAGVVIAVGGLFALNSYTVVQDGTEKTGKFLGEISNKVLPAGFHVVNPFASFNTWDNKERVIQEEISIPSQDKFKSGAKLSIKWSMEKADKPYLERTVGVQSEVERKLILVPLDSIVKDAGRNVTQAQDLFIGTVQNTVQAHIMEELQAKTAPYGIKIHEVFIGDIVLPEVIQDAIKVTKKMEEQTAQEKATLERQKLVYARSTAEAKANAESAAHNRKAAQEKADALAYAKKADADAELYSKNAEAKGNEAMAASVTPNLLKLKAAEAELIRAQNWKGGTPTHVFGGNQGVTPLYHMGNQSAN